MSNHPTAHFVPQRSTQEMEILFMGRGERFYVADIVLDEWAATLKPYETLVLIFLIRAANKNGVSWYGQRTIAKCLNMSRDSVLRSLRALETRGFINANKQHGNSTTYQLAWVVAASNTPVAVSNQGGSY